eukprot:7389324-Prymnesium_polylepis.1
MDNTASNYDPTANTASGFCEYNIKGAPYPPNRPIPVAQTPSRVLSRVNHETRSPGPALRAPTQAASRRVRPTTTRSRRRTPAASSSSRAAPTRATRTTRPRRP